MAASDLTAARLRELLHYDPETGVFTCTVDRNGGLKKGQIVGSPRSQGYLLIAIDGGRYMAHRLACFWMNGEWPTGIVDHINAVPHDNRWANLRQVSQAVNTQNRRTAGKGSKSGILGVSPERTRWRAKIMVGKKAVHLGVFADKEQAHAAYLAAKRALHEGCTI